MMTDEELNRLVAEKVMGWTLRAWEEDGGNLWWMKGDDPMGWPDGHESWCPSQSLSDAWQVVQHLKAQRMGPEDNYPDFGMTDESTPTRPFFWAYFDEWVDDSKYGGTNVTDRAESYSSTLPRAICFAALRCVGAIPERDARIID